MSESGRSLSRQEIEGLIPHRPPFLFLDQVSELKDSSILAEYKVRGDEDFFKGHYPNHPIMPGVLLCECVFQAGAVLMSSLLKGMEESGSKVPVVTRLYETKFRRPVSPGDTLKIEASLEERMASVFILKGSILKEGKRIVQLKFSCALMDPQS